ncbi:hypothetical protein GGI07_002382 [Coemansia sp. Benny D115]|nr:hypothetical protein GGI07_002382 [Coemansia sp. Benny D115]
MNAYCGLFTDSSQASNWVYRGEGNANILFAYTGSQPELQGKLLRLTKSKTAVHENGNVSSAAEDKEWAERHAAQLRDNTAYSKDVIGALIGPEYIQDPEIIEISASFITELNQTAEPSRPENRTHKQADPRQTLGSLVPDMIHAPTSERSKAGRHTVAVEIKPKWGYLPDSASLSPETSVKHRVCRFCMKQYTKQESVEETISEFCPLDLYSKNSTRIGHALDCLMKNPQNNLRVFVDGQIVGSSDDGLAMDIDRIPDVNRLKQIVTDIILTERLFPCLAQAQQRLDYMDIEGIFPKYQSALESGEISTSEPTIKDWLQAVQEYLERESSNTSGPTLTDSYISDRQAVLEFMIAVTLKDISVMLCFESWPPVDESIGDGSLPEYRIAIIDADPKKLHKIPDYLKQDQKIVDKYLKANPSIAQQKVCYE